MFWQRNWPRRHNSFFNDPSLNRWKFQWLKTKLNNSRAYYSTCLKKIGCTLITNSLGERSQKVFATVVYKFSWTVAWNRVVGHAVQADGFKVDYSCMFIWIKFKKNFMNVSVSRALLLWRGTRSVILRLRREIWSTINSAKSPWPWKSWWSMLTSAGIPAVSCWL